MQTLTPFDGTASSPVVTNAFDDETILANSGVSRVHGILAQLVQGPQTSPTRDREGSPFSAVVQMKEHEIATEAASTEDGLLNKGVLVEKK